MSYKKQVELLLKILPLTVKDNKFALKGGTAINLYYRDMPRYSVDIDLTPVFIAGRQETLEYINYEFHQMKGNLEREFSGIKIEVKKSKEGMAKQLRVFEGVIEVKIEINHILRGTFLPVEKRVLCQRAQDEFKTFNAVECLSFEDIYGGKICAMLDRQHPRDLFDVKLLLENEGYTKQLHKAFILYMISGNRPISEMINPNRLSIEKIYGEQFRGMAIDDVTLDDLLSVREQIIHVIVDSLTSDEREFLISLKQGEPRWELSGISEIDKYPSVQWKMINIQTMSPDRRQEALEKLKRKLSY